MFYPAVTVRAASPADSRTLDLLAWLTRRSRPRAGRDLLAERDGVPLAAISLTSGTVLADPGNTTPEIVRALRLTRYRTMRQGGRTGAARSLLSRPMTGTRPIRGSALS
jgi:hypothetical protein